MAHDNEALLERFYTAFAALDGAAMTACYADDVRFSDPVFPDLSGNQAGGMWRMLTGQAPDLRVEHSGIAADDETGRAHWEAWYTFSVTGRKVHNVIDATFRFRDGKIVQHTDVFDFYGWSKQALGVPGFLLGWTPLLRYQVRRGAGAQLKRFLAKEGRQGARTVSV